MAKRKIGELYDKPIVIGNPNEFTKNEISLNDLIGGGKGSSATGCTGHADVEGLKSIGWTDEDIAYYQAHGVYWDEEDDDYHKVTDDNKALYGILTVNNISTYKDRIVYLPKIDTSNATSIKFQECHSLVAIPLLDTSNCTSMHNAFSSCYSITYIPPLDFSNVTSISNIFYDCYSLKDVKLLNLNNLRYADSAFQNCYSLRLIPYLDAKNLYQYGGISNIFLYSESLTHVFLKNLNQSLQIEESKLLSKESLLYMIDNEAATSVITITLASYAYERLSNDVDIVAALNNHPNVSLASA